MGKTLQKFISYLITLKTCWNKRNSLGDHSSRKVLLDQLHSQAYYSREPLFANKRANVGGNLEARGRRKKNKTKKTNQTKTNQKNHTHPPIKKTKTTTPQNIYYMYFLFKISTNTSLKHLLLKQKQMH